MFREFLLKLAAIPEPFSSRKVAGLLDIRVTEVSRNLMRIHRMGFLKRKRTEKMCRSSLGDCRKGYQYEYSFSRQGESYLQWLHRSEQQQVAWSAVRVDLLNQSNLFKENLIQIALAEAKNRFRGSDKIRMQDAAIMYLVEQNQRLKDEVDTETMISYDILHHNINLENELQKIRQEQIKLESKYSSIEYELMEQKIDTMAQRNEDRFNFIFYFLKHGKNSGV